MKLLVAWLLLSSYSFAGAQHLRGSVESEDRDLKTIYDVVVIGAGWAGLGAARTLDDKGIDNIRICEARDYVGGRSHTVPFGSSTYDLGSQWITGDSNENPIWKVANGSPVPTIKTTNSYGAWSSAYGGSTPHRVPATDVDGIWHMYRNEFFPFQRRRQFASKDESLAQTVDRFTKQKSIKGDDRRGLDWILDTTIVSDYAASLNDLSTWWWNSDGAFQGGDSVIVQGNNKGYSGLASYYGASLSNRIDFDCEVTRIAYQGDVVTIDYKQGGNKKSYQAHKVVVTVPLGVLQADTIDFVPDLPGNKRNAISKLGMGLLNKFVIRFDDSASLPWPNDIEWVGKIAADGQQGVWTEFWNEGAVSGDKILVAWSAGREAARVEQLTEQQALAEIMESLREMFDTPIPDPIEVLQSRWGQDPFSRGSYSYHKVGSRPKMRGILAEPIDGKLYFAGEATSEKYPSTTHGAILSGISAGEKIVDKIRRNKRNRND